MIETTFNPKSVEPRWSEAWEKSGAFQPKADPSAEPFCIVIQLRRLGRKAVAVHGDIGDRACALRMMQTAARDLGEVDLLVNNAGIHASAPWSAFRRRTGGRSSG